MVNCEKDDTIETPIEQQTIDNSLAFSRLLQTAKAKKKEYNRIKPTIGGEFRDIDATFEAKYGEPQFGKSINLTKEDGRPILVTPLKDENNQISKLLLGYLEDNQEKFTVVDQSAKTGTVLYINTVNPEPVTCGKTNIGTKQLGGLFEIARRSDSDCNHEYNFWNTFNNLPPGCYNVSGNNCEGYVFNICEIEEVDESFTQPSDPYDAGNGGGSNNPETPDNNPGGGTGNPPNNTDEPNDPEEEEEENDICGVDPFVICANYNDAAMDSLAITLGLTNNEKECLKNSGNCDTVSGLASYVDENPENNAFSKAAALAICIGKNVDIEEKRINGIKFDSNLPVCLENMILDLMLGNFPYSDSMGNIDLVEETFQELGGSYNPTPIKFVTTYKVENITGNGETTSQYDNSTQTINVTVKIDEDLVNNGTKLAIIKTILHESIHAYLIKLKQQYPAFFNTSNDFAQLVLDYQNYTDSNNPQHIYMASIITNISNNVSNFVQEKYNYPVSTPDYYEAVCWSGMTHLTNGNINPLFANNYPNTVDQDNIIKIFNTENGTASYQGYSPLINNNCN